MISAEPQVSFVVKPKLAYSRSELAPLLGISTRSIQRLEDRGLLKSSKRLKEETLFPFRSHEVPGKHQLTLRWGVSRLKFDRSVASKDVLLAVVGLDQESANGCLVLATVLTAQDNVEAGATILTALCNQTLTH